MSAIVERPYIDLGKLGKELLPQVNFVIIAQPRSGSSLLTHTLRMHPNILMYGELFQDDTQSRRDASADSADFYREGESGKQYLQDTIYRKRYWSQLFSIGFKLLYLQASEKPETREIWRYLFDTPSVRVIHLKRRNLFESFVSVCEANISDRWMLPVSASQGHVGCEVSDVSEPIFCDRDQCESYLNQMLFFGEWVDQNIAGKHVLELIYEDDLCANLDATLKRVMDFLNTPRVQLEPQLKKQAMAPVGERVKNFKDLKSYFELSIHKRYFNDT